MNTKQLLTTAFLSFAIFLSASAAVALEVDETELKSAGSTDTVVFVNYTGPHTVISSAASIRGIGSALGAVTAKDPASPSTAGDKNRYYVIHDVDPSEKGKLDADIMFIGRGASVDHIDNLRRILSAYLASAYNYSQADADTLAVFITVYNAVYRGKLDSYQTKYKTVVTKDLTASSCGLALTYSEWPGNTQIVIPLFDAASGGLSTVDTSVISDTKVVQSMQQDDGKNIDSRKQMVDIKERESDNASAKAQSSQKKATDEQQKNTQKKQEAAQAQKEADTAKAEADAAQQKAAANPDDKKAQKEAEKKQAAADQKQQAADQKKDESSAQQKKTDEQQSKTEEAKQQAADAQAVADKKQTEAQNERTEIAKDQQQVIDKAAEDANAPSAYGLLLTDEKKLLSGIVKVNTSNGSIIHASPVTVIHNRTMFAAGDSFIAIAGENSGNGAVKLILLDSANMEMTKESAEKVADDSVLVQDGADYYCVIQDGGSFVLGKYDAALSLKLKSPVAVKSSTPVTVSGSTVLVTGTDGKMKVLAKDTLAELKPAAAK